MNFDSKYIWESLPLLLQGLQLTLIISLSGLLGGFYYWLTGGNLPCSGRKNRQNAVTYFCRAYSRYAHHGAGNVYLFCTTDGVADKN